MPDEPRRPCGYPRCGEYAVRNGRCEEHAAKAERQHNDERAFYRSPEWRRFCAFFKQRHPVCEDCGRKKTSDVHHVKKVRDFWHLRLTESNCMGLCHECHSVRTARGE